MKTKKTIFLPIIFIATLILVGSLSFIEAEKAKPDVILEFDSAEVPMFYYDYGKLTGFYGELSVSIFENGYNMILESSRKDINSSVVKIEPLNFRKDVLYSAPIYRSELGLYELKKANKKVRPQDHVIGIVEGRAWEKGLLKKGNKRVRTYTSIDLMIKALQKGEIQFFWEDENVLNHYMSKNQMVGKLELKKANVISTEFAYAIEGEKEESQRIVSYINFKLKDIMDSGEYERLYHTYFFKDSNYFMEKKNRQGIVRSAVITIIVILLLGSVVVYLRELRSKLKIKENFSNKAVEVAKISILHTDDKGIIRQVNDILCSKLGYEPEDMLGKKVATFFMKDNNEDKFFEEEQNEDFFCSFISNKNKEVIFLWNSYKVEGEGFYYWVSMGIDMTEHKKNEKKIRHMAYFDQLTGLGNRSFIMEELQNKIEKKGEDPFYVIYLDMDNFKLANDSYGHEYGDEILKELGRRLTDVEIGEKSVARLGGDEFVILLEGRKSRVEFEFLMDKIQKSLARPIETRKKGFILTSSMGVAIYPDNGISVRELIKNADTAMYHAKSTGKNTWSFYERYMNQSVLKRLIMEAELREAIKNDEFVLYYQPKYDVIKNNVMGFESLIRWKKSNGDMVPPGEFLEVAEKSGLIIEIGKIVFRKACEFSSKLEKLGLLGYKISVNISSKEISQKEFLEDIKEVIIETDIKKSNLEVEITESMIMEDFEVSMKKLEELKAEGIGLAMDDFGKGFSSLSYLRHLPIDVLKIDKSFIDNITKDQKDLSIARKIIELSKILGLKVVAEGIETPAQFKLLKEMECDYIQGYFISRPLEEKDAISLLTDRNRN